MAQARQRLQEAESLGEGRPYACGRLPGASLAIAVQALRRTAAGGRRAVARTLGTGIRSR